METEKITINMSRCDLCGTCVAVCAADCLTLSEHSLTIVHERCTRCQYCVYVCPVKALSYEKSL